MDWRVTYFSVLVAKELALPEAYALLDRHGLESWSAGGCAVLAQALSRLTGSSIYALVDGRTDQAEHFAVRIGNAYVDSEGAYSRAGLVAKFEELERLSGIVLRKASQKIWDQVSDDSGGAGIACPAAAVEELVAMLDDAVGGYVEVA